LIEFEWKNLEVIKDQLERLFHIIKALEGNVDFLDGSCKAFHGHLRELLLIFKHILSHFESLEKQVKANDFDNHLGITYLITKVWNKVKDYYSKTNKSIAWIALTVMNLKFKIKYFEDKWMGTESHFLHAIKPKVKKLWEDIYKRETVIWPQLPPLVALLVDYLTDLLNHVAL
jgi:hypothetical protein